MNKRILGVDIGITSIGWALIDFDDETDAEGNFKSGKRGKIIDCGARLFTQAENPDGAPLAEPRRLARSLRRRLSRRAQRLKEIKRLFVKYQLASEKELESLYRFEPGEAAPSPYELRKTALDRILTGPELARVLTQIAKRRGYKSMRLSEEKADKKKTGRMLAAIEETRKRLLEGKYRTVGEMLCDDKAYEEAKRNKQDDYKNSVPRELLQEEAGIIFSSQRELGSKLSPVDFEREYSEKAFAQLPVTIPEPGKCTFEPAESRAPKRSYSAEKFQTLQKINNLRLFSLRGKGERLLVRTENGQPNASDAELAAKLLSLCFKNAKVTYRQVRAALEGVALGIGDDWRFAGLDYRPNPSEKKKDNDPENKTFVELKGYNDIRRAVEKTCAWETLKTDAAKLDKIAEILTRQKTDEDVCRCLREQADIQNDELIKALSEVNMKGHIHLSLKALGKIIPHMEKGYIYSKACSLAGYDHLNPVDSKALAKLPPLGKEEQIRNPVVNRAISQFRKVVNAVLAKHCKNAPLDQMNIELARELSHSYDERMDIRKEQDAFRAKKEEAAARCKENGLDPEGGNLLLKFRLWEEQNGFCPYSGKLLDIKQLAETGYADIDHILPYSRSFDDSLNNKVLCLSDENRQKGNMTPSEYVKKMNRDWEEFATKIRGMNLKEAKRRRLLKAEFSDAAEEGFKERNLNDTRYVSRFVKNYALANLKFGGGGKQKVQTRSGALTSFLRHQWGLEKDRSAGDKHHALDAIVTACATQGMVQYLSAMSRKRELWKLLEDKHARIDEPWPGFKNEAAFKLSDVFVSRAPRHKVTGAAHQDTIRRNQKLPKDAASITRTPLTKLKLESLENLLYKDTLNKRLYKLLKEKLETSGGKADKAFAGKIYFPRKNGTNGPVVRKVPLVAETDSGIKVRKGLANNGEMVRLDVFAKDKEWFLVPIYVSDMIKKELPNKAIAQADWPVMDDTYQFKFTLQKNDLITVKQKGKEQKLGYYLGADRSTGTIELENHDRSNLKPDRIGARTLEYIKKYQVDPLGVYHEVTGETRLGTIPQMRTLKKAKTGKPVCPGG